MFLFIFESIGTSELILIGAVALIIFGPRKLPQMAKTLGKAMAEFRNTTNEFKSTWEREVSFEEKNPVSENTIQRKPNNLISSEQVEKNPINNSSLPEIREIDSSQFDLTPKSAKPVENFKNIQTEKQNWL